MYFATEVIGHIRCPDENIDTFGERGLPAREDGVQQLDFGVVGSGVINMGEGDQTKLPDSTRWLFLQNQGALLSGINMAIEMCGGVAQVSSHAGCGWVGLQGVRDASSATLAMCVEHGKSYAGHIRPSSYPEQVGNSQIWANMGRDESDHHHGAMSITATMDGGIEGYELAHFEASGYGDAFVVSVEGFCMAVANGSMTESDAITMLATEFSILDSLAGHRIVKSSRIRPFYSGRMAGEYAQYSRHLFDQAVASLVYQS
jgi:hypothetical protein